VLTAKLFTESIFQSAVEQTRVNLGAPIVPDLAIFNVGSLRLDDVVSAGTILLEYDVLRITPFLNTIQIVNVTGSYLRGLFNLALAQTSGLPGATDSQYLVYTNITTTSNGDGSRNWFVAGSPLDSRKWYVMAASDYLLTAPAPYSTLSQAKSPNDIKYVYKSISADPLADPRVFFMRALAANFPVPKVTPPTPPTAANAYVYFTITFPVTSIAGTNFLAQIQKDISVALQIRNDRVHIIQVAPSVGDQYATTVFFSIGGNISPDPFTADQAAAAFVTQANTPGSMLLSGAYTKLMVANSATISPTSTPPRSGTPPDDLNAAASTSTSIVATLLFAFVAFATKRAL
jgi:hypothetical protein